MSQEDTTTSTVQDTVQAQETAQPEELGTKAVQEQVESVPDTTEEVTNSAPAEESTSEEAELLSWAEKKGVKTDDPVALLKMVRESEKKMHETSQEARQLRETFNTIGEEQGLDDTSLLVNRLTVTDFYLNNPDARQYDDKMAQIVIERPYLANDLDTVYKLARFESAEQELLAQKQKVQKDTIAQVAKAEVAAPPQASASTRETAPTEVTDEQIANMSLQEYEEWKKTTGYNPFVA
jgi:hypothetical protein